jgi:hypothetical protein
LAAVRVELSIEETGRKKIAELINANLDKPGDCMIIKVKKGGPIETMAILNQLIKADECHRYKITADVTSAKITVKKI